MLVNEIKLILQFMVAVHVTALLGFCCLFELIIAIAQGVNRRLYHWAVDALDRMAAAAWVEPSDGADESRSTDKGEDQCR